MLTALVRRLLLTVALAALGLVMFAPAAGAEVIDPCLYQTANFDLQEVPQDADDCIPVGCTPFDVAELHVNGPREILFPCPVISIQKVFTDQGGDFAEPAVIPDFRLEAYDGTDTTVEAIATASGDESTTGAVTEEQYTVTEEPIDGWREVECADEVLGEFGVANSGTGTFDSPLQVVFAAFAQETEQVPVRRGFTHPVCNAPAPQVEVVKVFTDQDGVALDDAPDPLPDFTVELFSGTTDGDPVAADTPEATEADRTGTLPDDIYAVTETVADGFEEVTCAPATIEEMEAAAAGTGTDLTAPEPGTTIRHIVCNAAVPSPPPPTPDPDPVPSTATLAATTECGDEFPQVSWTVDVTENDDPIGEITLTVTTVADGEQIDATTVTADGDGIFDLEGYDGVAVEVAWDWDGTSIALTTRSDCPGSGVLAAGDEQGDQLPAAGPNDGWYGIAGLMIALGLALLQAAPRPRRQTA